MGLVKSTADEHHACQNPTKTEIDTDPFGYASTEQQNEPLRESQKSALDTKLGTVLHMHVQLGSSIGGEGGGGGGLRQATHVILPRMLPGRQCGC